MTTLFQEAQEEAAKQETELANLKTECKAGRGGSLGLDAALGSLGCMGHFIRKVIRLLTMPLLSFSLP